VSVDRELTSRVEQFLYHEARLLDERRFDEWLELFTDDVRYWMPVVFTRERGAREIGDDKDPAWYDDDKTTLSLRVKRLHTEYAWAEEPPSRTVRIVSNVEVRPAGGNGGELEVYSKFLTYKNRLEQETNIFAGTREDLLRVTKEGGFRIAKRKIILAQNVLLAKNISIFF
jgi:3-phenylpropionate/cinnamic acid dioxygenase small subunit